MEADGPVNGVEASSRDDLIPAAVLIPILRGGAKRRLLFTRRAPDLDDHAGQMSFPGGRLEADDADLQATALRETQEEIGVDPDDIELLGWLDPIETVTGFYVKPFVGTVPAGPYDRDPAEVAEIVTLPVEGLLAAEHYQQERRDHPERGTIRIHYFHVGEYTVWGATAEILIQFLRLTEGWSPPEPS